MILNKIFQLFIFELKIVDFVCDLNSKFSKAAKVIKILE